MKRSSDFMFASKPPTHSEGKQHILVLHPAVWKTHAVSISQYLIGVAHCSHVSPWVILTVCKDANGSQLSLTLSGEEICALGYYLSVWIPYIILLCSNERTSGKRLIRQFAAVRCVLPVFYVCAANAPWV